MSVCVYAFFTVHSPPISQDLTNPYRWFVRGGDLIKLCRKIPKPRYFVLFSDALLYGVREDAKHVKFHRMIPLSSGNTVKHIPDQKGGTPHGTHAHCELHLFF